jgi:hypothetical protein
VQQWNRHGSQHLSSLLKLGLSQHADLACYKI